ncbi:MAG TPA: antibiotic biosynthesis monooxygenase [Mycobacteriales bacterium]|jgi:quinol monooxygenase YgiN|nr:antibiotic biosynthesis monooxygenase [Mycobacteriales bacterium]
MILILGRGRVHADQRDAALAAAAAMSAASTAEAGCLEYSFWTAAEDPNAIGLVERWESDEALTAHMSAPHMGAFITAIGPTLDGGMDVVKHEVSSFGPLF